MLSPGCHPRSPPAASRLPSGGITGTVELSTLAAPMQAQTNPENSNLALAPGWVSAAENAHKCGAGRAAGGGERNYAGGPGRQRAARPDSIYWPTAQLAPV